LRVKEWRIHWPRAHIINSYYLGNQLSGHGWGFAAGVRGVEAGEGGEEGGNDGDDFAAVVDVLNRMKVTLEFTLTKNIRGVVYVVR
jgi:hypothetical protein